MNLESIIAIIANLVAILVAAKNDMSLFFPLKKNLFLSFFDPLFLACHKLFLFHKA
jgi:hypothetical protein